MTVESPRTRVFVVEDESLILMLLQDLLEEIGCECAASATRLEAAKKLAAEAAFDLAILDVNVRGETSYPVAEILVARGAPFVFATGYGETGVEDAWRHAPVLQKPYDARTLREAIGKALGRGSPP